MAVDPSSLDERTVVACTLYAEARGEFVPGAPDHAGYMAVAAVLRNRADAADAFVQASVGRDRHPLFGDGSLREVCLAPRQFSCWNEGDPLGVRLVDMRPGVDAFFDLALRVADDLLEGMDEADPTFGATHYLTRDAFDAAPPTHWCRSDRMVHTVDVLSHRFFRPA